MNKYNQIQINDRFNSWMVVSPPLKHPPSHHIYYTCVCVCGRRKDIKGSFLLHGKAISCQIGGCHKDYVDGMRHLPLARLWYAMMKRCYDPTSRGYRWYGSRGITVCARWHDFGNYLEDLKEQPEGLDLDRIDNDKGYSPENCRWVTHAENMKNTRTNVKYKSDGLLL